MAIHFRYFALLILFCTCGCSTVIEGRTQQIAIGSSPAGATCVIENNGDVIATVPETPGIVTIEKSKNDILVKCSKEGYGSGKKKNISDMAITSLGNMAFAQLSFLGNAVDSATGAAHKYDSEVFVTLNREPDMAQQQARAAPAPTAPSPVQEVAPPVSANAMPQGASPRAQALAGQLVQEIAQLSAAQPGEAANSLIIPPHTQELAGQLAREVAQLPANTPAVGVTP